MMKTVEILENKAEIMKKTQAGRLVPADVVKETENAAVLPEEALSKNVLDKVFDEEVLREIFSTGYAPTTAAMYAENAYAGVQSDALPNAEAGVLEAGHVEAQAVEAARQPLDFKYVWMGAAGLLLGGLALAGGGSGKGGSSGSDGGGSTEAAASGSQKTDAAQAGANTSATAAKNTSKPAQPVAAADKTDTPSETAEKTAAAVVGKNTQPAVAVPSFKPSVSEVAEVLPPPTIPQYAAAKQSGLTLDIARHFYPEEILKQYIDLIAKSGGTFLHLHLSDDENYAFESHVLGQRAADAVQNADGSYTNPATGKPFLSFGQVKSLAAYAKAKGVELVPEVDTPNHMDAVFALLEISKGKAYTDGIKSKTVSDEIDINNPEAIALVQSLYSEVIGLMEGGSRHFHIGGDEFGYSSQSNPEFIAYANTMAAFVKSKGLTPRMWNDGLLKSSLAALDKDIEITYWSYDGNPADAAAAAVRRLERADADDLLEQGFDILNYNSHYLYMVPQPAAITASGSAQMAAEIQSEWHLGAWDGKSGASVDNTDGVIGAALSIWGDDAATLSAADIFGYSAPAVSALINKTNATAAKADSAAAKTVGIDAATPFNHMVALDENVAERVEILLSDDLKASGRTFVWLGGQGGDYAVLSEGWQSAGVGELKGGNAYGLYKYGQNHLYIDTDMAVQII